MTVLPRLRLPQAMCIRINFLFFLHLQRGFTEAPSRHVRYISWGICWRPLPTLTPAVFKVHLHGRIRPSEPIIGHHSMVASVSDAQQQLEKLEPSDKEYRRLLYVLLNHQDLRSHVQGLHGSSLEGFIELLDKVSKANISTRQR